MSTTLWPWQKQALAYARGRTRIALFMEMRLGKSLVALRWAQHRQLRRVLLLAPLPTLPGQLNWEGAIRAEGLPVVPLWRLDPDTRLSRAQYRWTAERAGTFVRHRATGWFLANYEAVRLQPDLLRLPWDGIVFDESTRLRSPRAQLTRTVCRNVDHIKHRALLSGLPNPEDPLDFATQFLALRGEFLGFEDFWAMRQRLFHQAGYDWRPNRGVGDRIKGYLAQHAFRLTRKRAGVGPTLVYEMRTVEQNALQRKAIAQVAKEYRYRTTETKWAGVVHNWLARIAGGFTPTAPHQPMSTAKLQLLQALLTDEFKGESVVVWFRFNAEIDAAYQWLRERRRQLTVERIHGQRMIHVRDRQAAQERFQAGTTRVLLVQIALGQFGWNLSRANVAIYYSSTYEFEDRRQSEDRIVHAMKREPQLILDLVTLGTPDEDVIAARKQKQTTARAYAQDITLRINARLRGTA